MTLVFRSFNGAAIAPPPGPRPMLGPRRSTKAVASRGRSTIVMTVDDDADLQASIVDVLEEKGFFPVAVADGLEAFDLLRGGLRPSVILLDLMMPRMNGWEFRREQQRAVVWKDIPVVVTTAERFTDSSRRAEFGEVGWLPKPFDLDELVTAIVRALASAGDTDVHPDRANDIRAATGSQPDRG
jgi:CheY-like chemotaxis protein